jgi:hypothetical protein
MAGVFLSLRRVLPNRYPLSLDVERYIADEQRLGRMLDYAVIVPRLQRLYDWSAEELGEPTPPRAGARRQPDLRLALRAATRMAHSEHAVRSPGTRTRHTRPLKVANRNQSSSAREVEECALVDNCIARGSAPPMTTSRISQRTSSSPRRTGHA